MTRISVLPAWARCLGLVCVIGAMVAPGAASAAAPVAKPASGSCSATKENQFVHIHFRMYDQLYHLTGGQPEGLPPQRNNVRPNSFHRFGSLRIGAATCRSPKGWRVLGPLDVTSSSRGLFVEANNKSVTPTGKGPGAGWGIAVEKVHHGVMDVHALACAQGHLWQNVRELASFPLPVSYQISILQWVAVKFIPLPSDKVKCGGLGTDQLHVKASRNGTLRVTSPISGRNMSGIFESFDQSAGGNDVHLDHTRSILGPKIG